MGFLQLCLLSAVAENIVYLRGFHFGFPAQKSFRSAVCRGLLAGLSCLAGAASGWFARSACLYAGIPGVWLYPAAGMTLYLSFCAVCGAALWLFRTDGAGFFELRDTLNFAAFGTMLLTSMQCSTAEKAVMVGLSCALGCLMANILNYGFEQRLKESAVPPSMQGIPVMLLIYGMVSLALFGLTGRPAAI